MNDTADNTTKPSLLLFDVDGTLTVPRNQVSHSTLLFLSWLKKHHATIELGVVSGSDLGKLQEQLGDNLLHIFDWVCTENGLVTYHKGKKVHSNCMVDEIGEGAYQLLVNIFLRCLSNIELPIKRGTFLELRTGMLNVCPIGRSCSQEERDEFEKLDNELEIRKKLVKAVYERCKDYNLHEMIQMSIGGQISIDVFPKGWNKTYCLSLFERNENEGKRYNEIHFFGDRIFPGGNDYEIANDSRVIAHSVNGPADTERQVTELLKR